MVKYTIQRILLAIVTTAIILTLTFFLIKQLPFYPAIGLDAARYAYYSKQVTIGNMIDVNTESTQYGNYVWKFKDSAGLMHYFYIKPAFDQFVVWVKGIFTSFSWGQSNKIAPNVDAMVIIFGAKGEFFSSRMWTTIKINFWPAIISVPSGIALGIWAALKKNKMTDHVISTVVMIFISVPSFITITLMLMLFCYNWKILPSQWPSSSADIATKIKGYIIPTISLSFGSICGYCRFTRAELTEVMSSDFLLLARTKGLTRNQAITRHALKNAMVPILPSILAEIIGLLGGSMILEQLYGIPGVGQLYVKSLNEQDYNVLMADMALYTTIGLLSGVFLDLSYGFIDPRIRMGAKK